MPLLTCLEAQGTRGRDSRAVRALLAACGHTPCDRDRLSHGQVPRGPLQAAGQLSLPRPTLVPPVGNDPITEVSGGW